MYSRAARNVVHIVGSTPKQVGPGAYDIGGLSSNGDFKKQSLDSYAPFLSLSLREDLFSHLNETPGPGYYDLKLEEKAPKGCSGLSFKTKRFNQKLDDLPGPGAYSISDSNENKHRSSSANESKKVTKQRVKLNRKKNPPSIQDPKIAFGFEEGPNGELIPQAPPEKDSSIGPAYYNTNVTQESSPYKGIHFSKYTSKRTDFTSRHEGPAPGDYDVIEPVRVDVEHYHISKKIDKKPELNVPRYPENIMKTIQKECVPGPGKYEQKRLFDDSNSKQGDLLGVEIERPPFGTQAKRFDDRRSIVPGPGAYSDQRTAFDSIQKVHSLKKTPFLQSSARFEPLNSYKARSAPGPGQYRIGGFAEDNLRKAIIESRRRPAFGQSAERSFSLMKTKDTTPGPAQYKVEDKSSAIKVNAKLKSANFASNTKRDMIIEETPGPTAYDTAKAYENLVNVRREPPRNRSALKRQKSFNIVSRRDFKLAATEETPGPGAYDVDISTKRSVVHFATVNDDRWHEGAHQEALPGPADYELSPIYLNTLLKGTFNATLNNPLIVGKNIKNRTNSSLTGSKFGINSIREELKVT